MAEEGIRRRRLHLLLWLVALLIIQCIVCAPILDPNLEFGDLGDGRFNNCVCEYWYRFFTGKTGFNDLQSFYPVTDTLAWSDLMLGFGVPYTLLRLLGADACLAYKIVTYAVMAAGLYAMFWLLHVTLGLDAPCAFLGSCVPCLTCVMAGMLLHTQMLFISAIPLTTSFMLQFARQCTPQGSRKKRILYGLASVFMVGLEFWTAFYVGYFHFLLAMALLVFAAVYCLILRRDVFRVVWAGIRLPRWEWLLYLAAMALWFLPLLRLYLPVLHTFGLRDRDTLLGLSANFFLFLSASQNGGFWHSAAKWLYAHLAPLAGGFEGASVEKGYGLSLPGWLLLGAASILLICLTLRARRQKPSMLLVFALAAATSIPFYLILICSDGQGSLWIDHVMHLLPGAGALRAITRLISFLSLPAGFAIAAACQLAVKQARPVLRQLLPCLLAAFLIVTAQPRYLARWDAEGQRQMIAQVPQPPQDCAQFFIWYGTDPQDQVPGFVAMHDAWSIAQALDLDTLNGNSGQFPAGWGLYDPSQNETYLANVRAWVEGHALDPAGVYAYDRVNIVWIPYAQIMAQEGGTDNG